jgi:hypothetical protein
MLLQTHATSQIRSPKSEVRAATPGGQDFESRNPTASVSLPVIALLPALPKSWAGGSAKGLRARGALTVDLDWVGGQLVGATLRPEHHLRCVVRHGTDAVEMTLEAGRAVALVARLRPAINLR